MGFLVRLIANALAILAAAYIVPGIEVSGGLALIAAALVLGLINAVVRPVLLFLTLPFTLVTLGLFIFLLNAFCLWLTSLLVKGFDVQGFWSAVLGAMIVSLVSLVVTILLSDRGKVVVLTHRERDPDVIDISPKH
jgi:putative membrane protein